MIKRTLAGLGSYLLNLRVTSPSIHHTWIMVVLTVAIILIALAGASAIGLRRDSLSVIPLSAAFLVSLASPWLTAVEYRLGLRLVGGESNWRTALRVCVYSSLANALPIPGGIALRLRSMTEQGVGLKPALGASIFTFAVWTGVSVVAVSLAFPHVRWPGLLVSGTIGLFLWRRVASERLPVRSAVYIVGTETLFVASAAVRFSLVLAAIGMSLNVAQSIGLAGSGPLSSMIGLIPGGLGVFEALSAGLGVLVGIPAGAGFLAALIMRIMMFLALLFWIPIIQSQERLRAE